MPCHDCLAATSYYLLPSFLPFAVVILSKWQTLASLYICIYVHLRKYCSNTPLTLHYCPINYRSAVNRSVPIGFFISLQSNVILFSSTYLVPTIFLHYSPAYSCLSIIHSCILSLICCFHMYNKSDCKKIVYNQANAYCISYRLF